MTPEDVATKRKQPPESTALATLDGIGKALASVETLDEAVILRDKAAALRHLVKQRTRSLDLQNRAAFIKLQCERKVGELLLEIPKLRNRQRKGVSVTTFHDALKDAGISEYTARRWQSLARWPERDLAASLPSSACVNADRIADVARLLKDRPSNVVFSSPADDLRQ